MPDAYNPWGAPVFPTADDNAMQPETFVPQGVRDWTQQAAPKDYNILSQIAGSLGKALMYPGQVAQSKEPISTEDMVAPAFNLASMLTLGAGAAPQEANALNMGIKAYHGSPHDFEQFSLNHAGSTTDAGQLGKAHYLSTDPRVAESFPHKYEAEANLSSPLNLSMPDFRTDKRTLIRDALGLPSSATAEEVTAAAKAKGHDGVVLDYSPTGYKQKEIAVFNDDILNIMRKYAVPGMLGAPILANALSEQKT